MSSFISGLNLAMSFTRPNMYVSVEGALMSFIYYHYTGGGGGEGVEEGGRGAGREWRE